MNIAQTILSQLGGNKFVAMTGAKNFFTNGNDLCFTIGKNMSKTNRVQITLNGDDTYTMTFKKFTPERMKKDFTFTEAKVEVVKEYEHIYCDQLQELFTEVTGMYTHL